MPLTEKTIADTLAKAIKTNSKDPNNITDKEFLKIQNRFNVLCRTSLEGQAVVSEEE